MNKSTKKYFKVLTPSKSGDFRASVNLARTENGQRIANQYVAERLIYSFLVYRSCVKSGASLKEIAAEIGLHPKTISKKIMNLPFLVHQHEDVWFANEPPQGWFTEWTNLNAQTWSDSLAYVNFYPPSKVKIHKTGKTFGVNHAVIYAIIKGFAKKSKITNRLSAQYLSVLSSGLNRKTVATILADLQACKLIRVNPTSGKRLSIELLVETSESQSFFAERPTEPEALGSEQVDLPKTNKYQLKQDGFDDHRRLCEGLMAQSYAEDSIKAAKYLGFSLGEFESELRVTKARSDENQRSGKCMHANFGKYFYTSLQQKATAKLQGQLKEQAEERSKARRNSPEYLAKEKTKEALIRSDPLHPRHEIGTESILDRIKFSTKYPAKISDRYYKELLKHCQGFAKPDPDEIVQGRKLRSSVIGHALNQLNDFYGAETKATERQFQNAINKAILELVPEAGKLFDEELRVA